MKISLSERSNTSIWMLGRPKQILVHLTDRNPGPAEVDFESLAPDLQKQVLLGLKANNIVSDVDFDNLFAIYTRSVQPQQRPEMTDETKMLLRLEQKRLEEEARLKRVNKVKDAHEKLETRCKFILSKTVKAVKASVSKDTNLFFLRTMLQLEREGKNRKNVTGYIESRIKKVITEQEKKATKDARLPTAVLPGGQTNLSPVVESREGHVVITPEMLVKSAIK